jgi:hypothetical protein
MDGRRAQILNECVIDVFALVAVQPLLDFSDTSIWWVSHTAANMNIGYRISE